MSNHQLQITVNNKATVLERLLQVTRYRGFTVSEFSAAVGENNNQLSITLKVENLASQEGTNNASLQRLGDQLNKLIDVQSVRLFALMDVSNVNFQA